MWSSTTPAGHGNLYRVSLVAPYTRQSIVSNLAGAVGIALSDDLQFAYVTEQNTNSVSRITLANGSRQQLVTGLTAPFHLTWADASQSGLFVAERDPANRITRVNLSGSSATSNVVASGVCGPSVERGVGQSQHATRVLQQRPAELLHLALRFHRSAAHGHWVHPLRQGSAGHRPGQHHRRSQPAASGRQRTLRRLHSR